VFNLKILDATELIGIVGYERKAKRTSMRRNEKIGRADHRSTHFERDANLGTVAGCFVRLASAPWIHVYSIVRLFGQYENKVFDNLSLRGRK
jgi:hypothetical protein